VDICRLELGRACGPSPSPASISSMLARLGRRRAGRWRCRRYRSGWPRLEQWLGGRGLPRRSVHRGRPADDYRAAHLAPYRHRLRSADSAGVSGALRGAACLSGGDGRPPQAIPGGCSLSRPVAPDRNNISEETNDHDLHRWICGGGANREPRRLQEACRNGRTGFQGAWCH